MGVWGGPGQGSQGERESSAGPHTESQHIWGHHLPTGPRNPLVRVALEVPQHLPPAPQDGSIALDKVHSRDPTATAPLHLLTASLSTLPGLVHANGGLNLRSLWVTGPLAATCSLLPPPNGNHSNGECGTPAAWWGWREVVGQRLPESDSCVTGTLPILSF